MLEAPSVYVSNKFQFVSHSFLAIVAVIYLAGITWRQGFFKGYSYLKASMNGRRKKLLKKWCQMV